MVQLCGARGADPLTNEHRVRTTECPHLPHAFGSHLIVLCSLKQRTQFNSRLISVTASPQLHLPAPPPFRSCHTCLSCVPVASLVLLLPAASLVPNSLYIILQDYRKTLNEFQPEENASTVSSTLASLPHFSSFSVSSSLCWQVGRTTLFYLHTFGINWSSLYRVSFPIPSFLHGAEQHTHKAALSYFQSIKIT